MQLLSNTKVNLSQPLSPQLVCNQGNHQGKATVWLKLPISLYSDTYLGQKVVHYISVIVACGMLQKLKE